jgi:putative mycofactocin binding protein MftB
MQVPDYRVPSHVRLRSEDFGLLFYNTVDTKLTFAKCGGSLKLSSADDHDAIRLTLVHADEGESRKALNILQGLIQRGLIVEAGPGL